MATRCDFKGFVSGYPILFIRQTLGLGFDTEGLVMSSSQLGQATEHLRDCELVNRDVSLHHISHRSGVG